MRKVVMLLALVFPFVACADKPVEFSRLPAPAKAFVEKHFSDARVSFATVDKELFETTYDVTFADGRKIEFDGNGEWKDVDCGRTAVPAEIVPKAIADYVATYHPDNFVRDISRDKRHWDIELDNGVDLKFNSKLTVVEIDD